MFRFSIFRLGPSYLMNPDPSKCLQTTLPSRFGAGSQSDRNSSDNSMMTSSGAHATTHGGQIDHLVIDASGLTSAALRVLKNETQQVEREACRIVLGNTATLIKRMQPKKSIVVLMDGSEGMWKAAKTRGKGQNRKAEERAARGPGSNLALQVETALLDALPDKRFSSGCPLIVFSGSCCPGAVETKVSLWASGAVKKRSDEQEYEYQKFLEDQIIIIKNENSQAQEGKSKEKRASSTGNDLLLLSSMMKFRGCENDRVAIVGPTEMYFHLLTIPFKRCLSISQAEKDYKTIDSTSMLDWLTLLGGSSLSSRKVNVLGTQNNTNNLTQEEKENRFQIESTILKRMGQEMAFLMLLSQGHGGFELNSCQQLSSLQDLFNAYISVVLTDQNEILKETKKKPDDEENEQESTNEENQTIPDENSSTTEQQILVKNEHWLFERDFSTYENEKECKMIEKFFFEEILQLHQRTPSKQQQEQQKLSTFAQTRIASSDPSHQLVPSRFGLNMTIFRKVLLRSRAKLVIPAGAASQQQQQIHILSPEHPFSKKYPAVSTKFSRLNNNNINTSSRFADAAAYLDSVLQIFHLLCKGECPDPGFYLPAGFSPPPAWQIYDFTSFLINSSKNSNSIDDIVLYPRDAETSEGIDNNTLTPAEYGLLSSGSSRHFSDLAKLFVGQQVSAKFSEKVVEQIKSIPDALFQVRRLLRFANPNNAPRALCHSPAICLVEIQGKSPEVEKMLLSIKRQQKQDEEEQLMRMQLEKEDVELKKKKQGDEANSQQMEMTPEEVEERARRQAMLASASSASARFQQQQQQIQQQQAAKLMKEQRTHWRMFPIELGS